MPNGVWGAHAGGPTGGVGGAPRGERTRAVPVGASVELPMGPRSAVLSERKCQIGRVGRMWAVQLPMRPRTAVLGE
eukprot:8417706-Pyramimonas_sp.AAC.1